MSSVVLLQYAVMSTLPCMYLSLVPTIISELKSLVTKQLHLAQYNVRCLFISVGYYSLCLNTLYDFSHQHISTIWDIMPCSYTYVHTCVHMYVHTYISLLIQFEITLLFD